MALGWLGWSEDQALASDVNAIIVGYEGRNAMLGAIFGRSENSVKAPAMPVLTQSDFKAMFTSPAK